MFEIKTQLETNNSSFECDRLRFIVERDGFAEALAFAARTAISYRRMVIRKEGMCSTKAGREGFIKSYKAFKHFIRTCEGMGKMEERFSENVLPSKLT